MASRSAEGRSAVSGWGFRRLSLPLLLVTTALALLLRLWQIGSEGLWIDEAFSIWLARHPLGEMMRWVRGIDHHPPIYYTLLHAWTAVFGQGEGSARALSALLGGLTVPLVYCLGRRLVSEKVGLVAGLIFALSPFHVRLAQEARMYTLLTFEATIALHAFVKLYDMWMRDDSSSSRSAPGGRVAAASAQAVRIPLLTWFGYIVFTAAMLWTHNTAIFFPLAANLVVLRVVLIGRRPFALGPLRGGPLSGLPGRGDAPWLRQWYAAQAAIVLLWLPWLPTFLSQAADVYRRFWLPAPTLGSTLGIIAAFLLEAPSWAHLVAVPLVTALAVLAFLGLRFLDHRRGYAVLVGAMLVIPFAGQWLASLWRPILYARTLIWASIPLYVLVAAGLGWLEVNVLSGIASRRVALAALIACMAINGAALFSYYDTAQKEPWDDVAVIVAEQVQPDDILLFNDAWGQIPFDYYFGRLYNPRSRSSRAMSTAGPNVVEHGLPVDLFDRGVLEPEMTTQDLPRLRTLVMDHQRVWLIYSHQWYTDPQGLIPSVLATVFDLRRQWTFDGLQVLLYTRD